MSKFYDDLVSVGVINLYTLGKESKQVQLIGFNRKDKRHLCIFQLCAICSSLFDIKFSMKINIFTYLYLKRKYKLKKFMKYKNYPTKINVENFISHIENSNNNPLIFQKIFEEYYEVKND